MQHHRKKKGRPIISTVVHAAVLMGIATSGQAAQFQFGDTTLEWGNTLSYNLGVLAEQRDDRLLNNPGTDEGTASYDRGDAVANRLDFCNESASGFSFNFVAS